MLDLDHLAETRARSLNQSEEAWREALWSEDFQKLSQEMSDGEIEALIASCCHQDQFLSLVRYLLIAIQSEGESESPFVILQKRAQQASKSLSDWINAQFPESNV